MPPITMKPMPMMPRLPHGIQVASHRHGDRGISKELSDTTCPDKCCDEKRKAASPPPSGSSSGLANATTPTLKPVEEPSSVILNGSDHSPIPLHQHHHHQHQHQHQQQQQQQQHSFSSLDQFKLDDMGVDDDDWLVQSPSISNNMDFDESILSLISSTTSEDESAPPPPPPRSAPPAPNSMAPPPPRLPTGIQSSSGISSTSCIKSCPSLPVVSSLQSANIPVVSNSSHNSSSSSSYTSSGMMMKHPNMLPPPPVLSSGLQHQSGNNRPVVPSNSNSSVQNNPNSFSNAPAPAASSSGTSNFSANNNMDSNNNAATVLHQTCLLFPNDASVVQTALLGGPPNAATTPSPLPHQGYRFPLHLALSQGANLAVVQLLVQAGPGVLLQRDGPQGWTPLMLALCHLPGRSDVHQWLRKAMPQAASMPCTTHQDLPLHVACRNSTNQAHPGVVMVIQNLVQDYPAAVLQPNKRGLTPLQIVACQPLSAPHKQLLFPALQHVAAVLTQQQQQQQHHHQQQQQHGAPPQQQRAPQQQQQNNRNRGPLTAPC